MDQKKCLEIVERSNTGVRVTSDDWNLKYVAKLCRKVSRAHGMKWDKEVIIPQDDELPDTMFAAAKELLLQTGIYNITTGRIITLTEDEIDEGLANMKKSLTMGEGKDAYTLVARDIEDSRPPAVWAITYLWCATVMVAQAFKDTNPKHYAAVGIAMVPPVADFLYTQVTGSVGLANIWTEVIADGTAAYGPETTQALIDAGVMWNGVPAVKAGAIVTGIILGTIIAFIIDKRLDKVAVTALIGCVASAVGLIHSAQLGFYPTSPFTIAYLIMAVLAYILHLGRKSWFQGPDDYDYV